MYYEAIELFYHKNTFRFPALTEGLHAILDTSPHSSRIQHVHLKATWPQDAFMRMIRLSHMVQYVDASVGVCMQDLVDCCPSLDTLVVEMRDYSIPPMPEELRYFW